MSNYQLITKQARLQRKLIDDFNQRWRREYLAGLRQHHQATQYAENSVWDVVQIHDNSHRARWKLAVVQQLILGNDGLIRSAVIKTRNGATNTPIVNLYPLEVQNKNL